MNNFCKISTSIRNFIVYIKTKFHFFSYVHYINGPSVLPPPLSKDDEQITFSKLISEDTVLCEEARNTLIIHNLRLVVYIAKKFESTGINLEDLISIGSIGLIKAVNTFSPEKNIKLATYASRCIENEILMFLRKGANKANDLSIDEPLNVDWDGNELLLCDILGTDNDIVNRGIEYEVEKGLLMEAVDKLGAKEKAIMIMRFGLLGRRALTQKQVAVDMGISQSYISRLEKKIISQLKNDLETKL